MPEDTYNGWANYATWRINLEYFDGRDLSEDYPDKPDGYEVANVLKEEVQEFVDEACENTYVAGWANAFLDDVNWDEIADHLIQDAADNDAWPEDEDADED